MAARRRARSARNAAMTFAARRSPQPRADRSAGVEYAVALHRTQPAAAQALDVQRHRPWRLGGQLEGEAFTSSAKRSGSTMRWTTPISASSRRGSGGSQHDLDHARVEDVALQNVAAEQVGRPISTSAMINRAVGTRGGVGEDRDLEATAAATPLIARRSAPGAGGRRERSDARSRSSCPRRRPRGRCSRSDPGRRRRRARRACEDHDAHRRIGSGASSPMIKRCAARRRARSGAPGGSASASGQVPRSSRAATGSWNAEPSLPSSLRALYRVAI